MGSLALTSPADTADALTSPLSKYWPRLFFLFLRGRFGADWLEGKEGENGRRGVLGADCVKVTVIQIGLFLVLFFYFLSFSFAEVDGK